MTTSTNWWTGLDREKYSKQKMAVWEFLSDGFWWPVQAIEDATGVRRVASRIDELRDDWNIETVRGEVSNRALYKMHGRQPEGYVRLKRFKPTTVEHEVIAERRRQVAMGYTAEHDDGHDKWQFPGLILDRMRPNTDYQNDREAFIQIAALAVAAVERIDRLGP